MVQINENITEAITMLENLLTNCIERENIIRIHGNINEFTVRHSSVLDEFQIDYDELCLVCGWFEVDIRKNITDINYDDADNSVHIVFEEGELYLDFDEYENLE